MRIENELNESPNAKRLMTYVEISFCMQYIFLSIMLVGCGVNKQEHHKAVVTLEVTKRSLEESQRQAEQCKTELTAALKKINDLSLEIKKLKEQDSNVFTEAGRFLDSGDLENARRAYAAFIRDFPNSAQLVINATSKIAEIDEKIQKEKDDASAKQAKEQEANEARAFIARLVSQGFTVSEWGNILKNKTQGEIKAMFGPPDSSLKLKKYDCWVYKGFIIHPVTERRDALVIRWWGEKVDSYAAGLLSDDYWNP